MPKRKAKRKEITVINKPKSKAALRAFRVIDSAKNSATNLLETYEVDLKKGRRPTDEEQDLLRAMLIFSCSGLDAMVKQLVKDCLGLVIKNNKDAKIKYEDFAYRVLRGKEDWKTKRKIVQEDSADDIVSSGKIDTKVLTKILLSKTNQEGFLDLLVGDLTAGSLQSEGEVFRVIQFFGMDPTPDNTIDPKELRKIFGVRNKIIHEMDVDFESKAKAHRRSHRKDDILSMVKKIFELSSQLLSHVDKNLKSSRG